MIDELNKIVNKIDKLKNDMDAISNGAIVDPKTGKILKDKNGKIKYYRDKK